MTTHTATFTAPLVVGAVVTGFTEGRTAHAKPRLAYRTEFSGTYQGLGTSEWDGEPIHHFTEGVIGNTPQARFGIPAATVTSLV